MKRVRAADLVLDFETYGRGDLNPGALARCVAGFEAGAAFPPVVVCRRTNKVADGFHRVRAAVRVGGEAAEVDAVFKDYKSEGARLKDAARLNAAHLAEPLDNCDRLRFLLIGERLGVTLADMAAALGMEPGRLEDLRNTRTGLGAGGVHVPLKRTVADVFNGRKMTPGQEEANRKLSGMTPLFYANQLIMLLRNDMLPAGNENLEAGLRTLYELLESRVGPVG